MDIEHLKNSIRNIPDYPKPGIQFKDITPILQTPELFGNVIDIFYDRYKSEKIDVIVGIESRGFIFAAPLALKLSCRFVLARKPGKLPSEPVTEEYELEYQSIGMSTDYDCWHDKEVTMEMIFAVMEKNVHNVKKLIEHVIPLIKSEYKLGG